MKVLHINTSDSSGGAAIAAFRLHTEMLNQGIDSFFFCLNRTFNDNERVFSIGNFLKFRSRTIDVFKRHFFYKQLTSKKGLFSKVSIGHSCRNEIDYKNYDIIYIHWVNNGFLNFQGIEEILKSEKKVFWFMHDMFPITGGCHQSFECSKYINQCNECPYLKKNFYYDLAKKQFNTKVRLFSKYKNLSFITPSNWLFECTKKSYIAQNHNVYCIPNLLDTTIFFKFDKLTCRKIYNISPEKKVILFGADSALTNPYKGFDFFMDALQILNKKESVNNKEIEIVLFGSSYNQKIDKMIPFQTKFIGYLHDNYSLAMLYNSADVFCIPSLADNFPNTILEAINCKLPVVGFNVGGIPDMVNRNSGYLAEYKNSMDLAVGIETILNCKHEYHFDVLENLNTKKIIDKHKALW